MAADRTRIDPEVLKAVSRRLEAAGDRLDGIKSPPKPDAGAVTAQIIQGMSMLTGQLAEVTEGFWKISGGVKESLRIHLETEQERAEAMRRKPRP